MQHNSLQDQREAWKERLNIPLVVSGVLAVSVFELLPNLLQVRDIAGWKAIALLFLSMGLIFLAANAVVVFSMITSKKVIQDRWKLFLLIQIASYAFPSIGIWANIMDASFLIGTAFAIMVILVGFLVLNLTK